MYNALPRILFHLFLLNDSYLIW